MAGVPLSTDRRDLLLDANNDLVITTDLQFSTGVTAVAQSCRIALQMFKGEWFLNLDAGIPYWQSLLGKKSEAAIKVAQVEFAAALRAVAGVAKVLKCDVNFDGPTRKMSVDWQVLAVFSDTPTDVITTAITVGAS